MRGQGGRVRVWAALGALVLVGALAGLAASTFERPTYSATATTFVSTSRTSSDTELSAGGFSQDVVSSYGRVATTPLILDAVIDDLRLRTTSAALARQVTVRSPDGTAVLMISAVDPSAQRAAAIANAVQGELAASVQQLSPVASSTKVVLQPLRSAVVPDRPASGGVAGGLLIGASVGAAIWLVVVLVRALRRVGRAGGLRGTTAPSMF